MKAIVKALSVGFIVELAAMLVGFAAFVSDSHLLGRTWAFLHIPSSWLAQQLFSVSGRGGSTFARDFLFIFVVQALLYAGIAFVLFFRRHDNTV